MNICSAGRNRRSHDQTEEKGERRTPNSRGADFCPTSGFSIIFSILKKKIFSGLVARDNGPSWTRPVVQGGEEGEEGQKRGEKGWRQKRQEEGQINIHTSVQ